MYKSCIKLLVLIIAIFIVCSICSFADTNDKEVDILIKFGSNSFDIKQDLEKYVIDKLDIKNTLGYEIVIVDSIYTYVESEGTLNCNIMDNGNAIDTVKITYKIVKPSGYTFNIDKVAINKSDSVCESSESLLNIINDNLTLTAYGEEYNKAIGNGVVNIARRFNWADCNRAYDRDYVGVYEFKSTYKDFEVTKKLIIIDDSESISDYIHNDHYNDLYESDGKLIYKINLEDNQLNKIDSNILSKLKSKINEYESNDLDISLIIEQCVPVLDKTANYNLDISLNYLKDEIQATNFNIIYINNELTIKIANETLKNMLNFNSYSELKLHIQKIHNDIEYVSMPEDIIKDMELGSQVYYVDGNYGYLQVPMTYEIHCKVPAELSFEDMGVYFIGDNNILKIPDYSRDYTYRNIIFNNDSKCYIVITGRELDIPYKNISKDTWYYDGIRYCYENGLLANIEKYEPNEIIGVNDVISLVSLIYKDSKLYNLHGAYITRAELAEILANILIKFDYDNVEHHTEYEDTLNLSDEQASAIDLVSYYEIMIGTGNNRFSPDSNITYAQLLVTVYRLSRILGEV